MREMIKIIIRLNPLIILILISFTLLTIYPTAYSQTDEESLLQKGINAVLNSQFEEGIIYFDKILESDPQNVNALQNKGVALGNLERHSEAIYHFDKVLEIDPNNTDALNNKGAALVNLERHSEAIYHFDKVLEIDPNNTAALNNIGAVFINLVNYGEALPYFDRVLELDPENQVAINSKKDIQTYPITTESPPGDKVTTMAAYLQLNIRDSNGNLVNYIETERIFMKNLTRFNHFLDLFGSGEYNDDSSVREATISIAHKNVTKNGQDLQLVTIRNFGNYFGQELSAAKTILYMNSTWQIYGDHDGYPIRYGDNFDILWNIWRPIS